MLVPTGSPIQNSSIPPEQGCVDRRVERARQVIAAGFTAKGDSTCIPGPQAFTTLSGQFDTGTLVAPAGGSVTPVSNNLGAQVEEFQRLYSSGLLNFSNILDPVMTDAGQQGATADFQNGPEVVPMNTTESMIAQKDPAAMQRLRDRGKQMGPKRPGVPWGELPVSDPDSRCGSRAGLRAAAESNPFGFALLALGLGVVLVAAVSE